MNRMGTIQTGLAVVAAAVGCLGAATAAAQQAGQVELARLTERIYRVTATHGYEVNFVASVGADGILLVDTGFAGTAKELQADLAALDAGPVRFVINTHAHRDHNGGNGAFGREAVVISHRAMRDKMTRGDYVLEEHPSWALPDIVLDDRLTLFFNGERIEIIALPGSHDSDDLIVHFVESKVVYMGDVGYGVNYPSYDTATGDATRYAEIVRRAIDMLPDDVLFISGHGADGTRQDMEKYQRMLAETTRIVLAEMAQGKGADQIDPVVLGEWDSYAGPYVSARQWIANLVDSARDDPLRGASPIEAMYRAYRAADVRAAVAAFHEYHDSVPRDYSYHLYRFADFLMDETAYGDAIVVFDLLIATYGDSPYLWYFYRKRADAQRAAGDDGRATEDYQRALELNPNDAVSRQRLGVPEA